MSGEQFDYQPLEKRQGQEDEGSSPRRRAKAREEAPDYTPKPARRGRTDRPQRSQDEYAPRPARRARKAGRSARRGRRGPSLDVKTWGRLAALVALLVLVVPTVLVVLGGDGSQPTDPLLASLLAQLQQEPNNATTLVSLGDYYYDQGIDRLNQNDEAQASRSFESAAGYYVRALQEDATDTLVRTRLGTMYFYRGQLEDDMMLVEQAIQTWQTVLALEPDKPEALYSLGIAYSTLGQIDQAVAMWERVIEVAPGSTSAQSAQELIDQYRGQ